MFSKKQKILRRCWNKHIVKDNSKNICHCGQPLVEYYYEDDRQMAYDIGNNWGDDIIIEFPEDQKLSMNETIRCRGWKPRRPRKDDYVEQETVEGRILILKFTEVNYAGDPYDLFFGELMPLFYMDQINVKWMGYEPIYEREVRKSLGIRIPDKPTGEVSIQTLKF